MGQQSEWQVTGISLRGQNSAPERHLVSESGHASLIFIFSLCVYSCSLCFYFAKLQKALLTARAHMLH